MLTGLSLGCAELAAGYLLGQDLVVPAVEGHRAVDERVQKHAERPTVDLQSTNALREEAVRVDGLIEKRSKRKSLHSVLRKRRFVSFPGSQAAKR